MVAAIGVAWYAVSVAATGGDWGWPAEWAALIARYAPGDLSVNAAFVVSLPGLLARAGFGVPAIAAVVALAATAVAAAVRRAGAVEAASGACLAGVALSPHALAYDAALALPMIAFAAVTARRTRAHAHAARRILDRAAVLLVAVAALRSARTRRHRRNGRLGLRAPRRANDRRYRRRSRAVIRRS